MLEIGAVVLDTDGKKWVYIGYRVTTVDSYEHSFVRALEGRRHHSVEPWTWKASRPETVARKFPGAVVRTNIKPPEEIDDHAWICAH